MTLLRHKPFDRYSHTAAEAEDLKDALRDSLMFPKKKYVPRGSPSDLDALPLPKEHPDRNRPYLNFVRSEICAVNGVANHECAGVTEAAHLEVHGKSVKASDYLTVPLCTFHHLRQHSVGIAEFQITYQVNLWEVAMRILVRWVRMEARRG